MSVDAIARDPEVPAGVFMHRRSSIRVLHAIVRDPVRGLPPAVFEHRLTIARNFGRTRAYVSDPALIHEAVVRNADALHKGEEINRVLAPALGNGLLTSDGPAWRWQRQAIAPTFQHEKLKAFLPLMIAAAETTRDRWLSQPPGATLDVGHEMMMTTFQIIVDTMLSGPNSMDAARVEQGVSDYLKSTSWMFAMAMIKAPRWMPFPGSRRAKNASGVMRGLMEDMVARRRQAADRRDDLVTLLLEAADPDSGRKMTDEEITDNILTFVSAGHETTALALAWTLMLLAEEPGCVARLLAEIESVTGGGPIQAEHVAHLAYTRQVVNEGMRLYPPAPLISRTLLRDMELGGATIPKGSILIVPIYAVHRHNAIWDRPEVFDPDRFAPAAIKGRHRYAFMPFGAGPRVCIGNAFATMEAVAILAVLVRALTFQRVAKDLPQAAMRVTLRPLEPLQLRVAKR